MTSFKKIEFANGTHSLQDVQSQQIMHSAIGPMTEARDVYSLPALQWMAQQNKSHWVVFDVGLGTGSNVTGFLNELKKQPSSVQSLEIHSFENRPDGLRAALEHEFETTRGYEEPLKSLLETGIVELKNFPFSVRWTLHTGDYKNTATTGADLVFFDLYSPKFCPELWDAETFERTYRKMNPQSLLITYAAAGWVKRNLKQVGFEVLTGPGTAIKRETTHAIKCAIQ